MVEAAWRQEAGWRYSRSSCSWRELATTSTEEVMLRSSFRTLKLSSLAVVAALTLNGNLVELKSAVGSRDAECSCFAAVERTTED